MSGIGLGWSTSLGNSGLCWTVFARNGDTAVPAEGNGDLQTLICILVARPRWCLTLSNPVPWQNWMAAYLGYSLRMRTLFRGWPIMVNDTHTRRRSGRYLPFCFAKTFCNSIRSFCYGHIGQQFTCTSQQRLSVNVLSLMQIETNFSKGKSTWIYIAP